MFSWLNEEREQKCKNASDETANVTNPTSEIVVAINVSIIKEIHLNCCYADVVRLVECGGNDNDRNETKDVVENTDSFENIFVITERYKHNSPYNNRAEMDCEKSKTTKHV